MTSDGYVAAITVKSVPANVSPDFRRLLEKRLRKSMALCATGKHPLRLEVTVTTFRRANAGMTILVGSSNAIEGSARLVEPADGTVVGDFDIMRSTGGGGFIAAAVLASAEQDMTRDFARDVCKKAFGREPEAPLGAPYAAPT